MAGSKESDFADGKTYHKSAQHKNKILWTNLERDFPDAKMALRESLVLELAKEWQLKLADVFWSIFDHEEAMVRSKSFADFYERHVRS